MAVKASVLLTIQYSQGSNKLNISRYQIPKVSLQEKNKMDVQTKKSWGKGGCPRVKKDRTQPGLIIKQNQAETILLGLSTSPAVLGVEPRALFMPGKPPLQSENSTMLKKKTKQSLGQTNILTDCITSQHSLSV